MNDRTPLLFAKRIPAEAPTTGQYGGTVTELDLKTVSDRALKTDIQPLGYSRRGRSGEEAAAQYAGTATELDLKGSDRALKTEITPLV